MPGDFSYSRPLLEWYRGARVGLQIDCGKPQSYPQASLSQSQRVCVSHSHSQKGRENIPVTVTNRRGGAREYSIADRGNEHEASLARFSGFGKVKVLSVVRRIDRSMAAEVGGAFRVSKKGRQERGMQRTSRASPSSVQLPWEW
eukprot:187066-Pyramimonas_sp.AAC.2